MLRSEARKKTVGSEVAAGYEMVCVGGGGGGVCEGGGGDEACEGGVDVWEGEVCEGVEGVEPFGSGGAQLACRSWSRRDA